MQIGVQRELQHGAPDPVSGFAAPLARAAIAAALASTCALGTARAQEIGRRCQNTSFEPQSEATGVSGIQQPDGSYITYASRGVIMVCSNEGIRLVADSAEHHQAAQTVYLFGRVRYTEGATSVNARRITYWQRDERILAEGDVVARLENGTTMTGPRAEYLRAVPGLRERAQLRATERPHITLVRTDSAAAPAPAVMAPPGQPTPGAVTGRPDTTVVDANSVFMDGDSLVYASGRVVVTRPDLVATSDSLALDRATERARFIGNPVMRGIGERTFPLTGGVIDIFSRERKLERVLSRVGARVVSDEVQLTADTIDLRILENRLDRVFAFGSTGARAISEVQDVTADSIEIAMPNQRIREVRAVGKARAESEPDSTRIASTDRDWIQGDTIIARFDSIPAGDTTSKARIQELRALVRATSFYQIPPDDSASRCPKINYSRGDRIVIAFDSQTVERVSVVRDSGVSDGLYLECRATAANPGSAAGSIVPAPPGGPPPATTLPPSGTSPTPRPTTARPPE